MGNETNIELLPCPFCGSEPLSHAIAPHTHSPFLRGLGIPDHGGSHVIECGCGAGLIDDTLEDVTTRWNHRALSTPPSASMSVTPDDAWKACRRQVFSLCESTQDIAADSDFNRGRIYEAKGIAKAMNAFGPESCDFLAALQASHSGNGDKRGASVYFDHEEAGIVVDALIEHRASAEQRKGKNAASSSDYRADKCAELIGRVNAAPQSAQAPGGEAVAWDYPVADEPRYPGDSMREACWTASEAERLKSRGYNVRPLFDLPAALPADGVRPIIAELRRPVTMAQFADSADMASALIEERRQIADRLAALPAGTQGEDGQSALWALRQIIADLPDRRDWMDPDVEKVARALIARNRYADLAAGTLSTGEGAKRVVCCSCATPEQRRLCMRKHECTVIEAYSADTAADQQGDRT